MRIYEFTLKEFKPLLHNNIRKIHVQDISQITILTGPNGWGKSSILRELTPYAAVRSDYNKNGLKVLRISHDKSDYVLTSDFSKTTAHSFIKDDHELNVSGTTDVQNDLVNTHFGYSKLLDNLLLGTMKITAMGRPARREMFMATYPGSLAFILNHFNRLSSLLRTTTGQLKLLKERHAKMSGKLISAENLDGYNKLKDELDKTVITFDQNLFMCNNMLETLNKDISKMGDVSSLAVEYFNSNMDKLSKELDGLRATSEYDIIAGEQLNGAISTTTNIIQSLTSEHKALLNAGVGIKEDIDKYNQYLSMDVKESIKRCEDIIIMQKSILKDNVVNTKIPVMDPDTLEDMEPRLPEINEMLISLRDYDVLWTRDEHGKKLLEHARINMEIKDTDNRHTDLLNKIAILDTQLKASGEGQYPKDCDRVCNLRLNVKKNIDYLTDELRKHQKLKVATHKKLEKLKADEKELKASLEGRATAEGKIDHLERLIARGSWGYFVCNNTTLISALNANSTDVWNRLVKVVRNSRNSMLSRKAQETLEVTKAKLESLKVADIPAKTIITENLLKKELELKAIHNRLDSISSEGKLLQARKTGYIRQSNILKEIRKLKDKLKRWVEYKKMETEQTLLKDIIEVLMRNKTATHEKLRSIESIILEQRGFLTIINDELAPTMVELEERLRKLTLITDQLSPTNGIPYKYSIQYINDIFKLANKFIQHIWEHDLELVYFKDKDSFDFIFKLLINNTSELKDINMCSKGQKSLVDLVVNLAICIYRGYAQLYPLKLDEIDDGLTPAHQARLTEFLGELLQQNTINQVFIMNHQLAVSSSFQNAGVISLSPEDVIPAGCRIISKIN